MHMSDVVSAPGRAEERGEAAPLPDAPELWPVGPWDAAWIVAGVVGAQLLLLLV